MKRILILPLLALALMGCEPDTTDTVQAAQNEQMVAEANAQVGMPRITRFTERRLFKSILEQRDETFSSYTYTRNLDGVPILFCRSIGYGLPAATQFTNPERIYRRTGSGYATLPQADPNGMFMPSSSDATYVLCANGSAEGYDAEYVEERITVTTRPLRNAVTKYSLN